MNLGRVQKAIDAGKLRYRAVIDQAALRAAGLGRGGKDGVRLLAKGELTTKVSFKIAPGASKGATAAVEALGGSIELIIKVRAEKVKAEKTA